MASYTRLAIYMVGLVVITVAAWVFLTQTEIGRSIPSGVALALILLLVGVGIMASATEIRDSRSLRRVVHDAPPGGVVRETRYGTTYDTTVPPPSGETVVEERRDY